MAGNIPGFDGLRKNYEASAQKAIDQVDGTTTSKESSSLKIHNFWNIVHGNNSVVLARGTKFRACNGLFFKKPLIEEVVAVIDTSEKKIDVDVQTYYSSDEQAVKIDWYIKYNVVDAAKMLKKTSEIETTIQEDTEYLMSSYLKTKTAEEISKINKVTSENLEEIYPGFLDKFEETYGVKLAVINSNNIVVPLIQSIVETEKQEASSRKINEANRKAERDIRTADANAALDIRKKQLTVDKERLDMYAEAINQSKAPDALARMMSDGQNIDVYHHGDQNLKRHR